MHISAFDLNLLKVLDALLREGSTVRAAERVGLSQPAVSAALGRLRHALGDPLFVRRGQGMEPTDFAKGLTIPVREILDRSEALLTGPGVFDPARATQSFKISGSDFFAELLMPELARTLSQRAPGMRVQLVDLVPDSYVETLDRYEVDIAMIPDTAFPDWVAHRPIFRSSFDVIARAGHPRLVRAGIAPGDAVPLDLFCDLGHVLFSPEGNLRAMGDSALARLGRERRVAMTMPVFSGVYRAVAESDLVALIPRQLARRVAPKMGLVLYRPPMPVDPVLIMMIWHRRATTTPAHRWLRDLVAELMLPLNEGEASLPAA